MKSIWVIVIGSLLMVAGGSCSGDGNSSIKVQQITMGYLHSCMIDDQGSLWCWGGNYMGALGIGSEDDLRHTVPIQVSEKNAWSKIAAGIGYTCAIKKDGSLWCWGSNLEGQSGAGSETSIVVSPTSVFIESGFSAQQIYAGKTTGRTCAIGKDGDLWCWGKSAEDNDPSAIQYTPQRISSENQWRTVAVGMDHNCAIRYDNSLWCWGQNHYGELGNENLDSIALDPQQVGTDTDWNLVTTGWGFTCAIRADGKLYCFGDAAIAGMKAGVVTPVGTASDWVVVSAGHEFSCGIRKDKSLWCWGSNYFGQLGIGWDQTTVSSMKDSPQQVTGGEGGWTSVDCGEHHACATNENNQIWCWGLNDYGQLGNDVAEESNIPLKLNETLSAT